MFDWLFGRTNEETSRRPPAELPSQVEAGLDREEIEEVLSGKTEHLEARLDTLTQHIRQLADQAETLQEQLARLDHRTSFGNEQIETLTQHLSDVAGWADPLDQRLAELVTWAEQSQEELTQLHDDLRKLSRTQFKTNSLTEAQQERLQSALETLQGLATRKQEAAERSHQEQRKAAEAARHEAKVAMVADLFPALDGLESAMENGRALLERSRQRSERPGFLTRLAYAFGMQDLPAPARDVEALRAWLDGLELVRERFLALLRSEGIQPIHAEGKSFDPHFHVAVEAVERPDVAPGTVLEQQRPGYRLGDRVLRYAEVVVVRDQRGEEPAEPEGTEEPAEPDEPKEPEGLGEAAEAEEIWTPVREAEGEAAQEPEEAAEGLSPPASDQAAKPEEPRASNVSDDESNERPMDPEIQEMIARFEERRRARREE